MTQPDFPPPVKQRPIASAAEEGNIATYEEDKKRRLGFDSVIPHRLKYKQFSR